MQFYNNHERLIKKILSATVPSRSLRHQICATLQADCGVINRLKAARTLRLREKSWGGVLKIN